MAAEESYACVRWRDVSSYESSNIDHYDLRDSTVDHICTKRWQVFCFVAK